MQRRIAFCTSSKIANLLPRNYVSIKVSQSKRYAIHLSVDAKTQMKSLERLVKPIAVKESFHFKIDCDELNPNLLKLSMRDIDPKKVEHIHSQLTSKAFPELGEKVESITDIMVKSGEKDDILTADGIHEDIFSYPDSAIPRRTNIDSGKWRLRNPFRIGIN